MYKNGFTLVELLIYMAIMSLLFLGVITIAFAISSSNDSFQREVKQGLEYVFLTEYISSVIRMSATSPAIYSSSTQLSIQLTRNHIFKFFEEDNEIVLQRDTQSHIPLTQSKDISNLYFERVSTSSLIHVYFISHGSLQDVIVGGL